ncbi:MULTISPECIES: hypothetical protein [Streptomyces]|nr:hypothetical protein [Streptomyces canarius]
MMRASAPASTLRGEAPDPDVVVRLNSVGRVFDAGPHMQVLK